MKIDDLKVESLRYDHLLSDTADSRERTEKDNRGAKRRGTNFKSN